MWTRGWRDEVWSRLDQDWDLIVIGGGITGAGILAEAARHDVKALLVEANDFASGTSSRSTKLVHGGLRYLRQAQIRLTRESVTERENLLREGGGLVTPLGFFLTSFEGDRMPGWMFGVGLAMYDILGKKWDHERYRKGRLMAELPSLEGSSLKTAYHYYDAQTDDARLVVRVLREAVRRGGTAVNYARASDLLRDASGRVVGVQLTDGGPKPRTAEVKAKVVINATGAWADHLRTKLGTKKKLRAIRGSHLVFPAGKLPLGQAISLLHPRDGRAVFAIPWEGVTLVGTTDVDHAADLAVEPGIASLEIEYLLEAVHHAFPSLSLSQSDVRSTFSGVRAVIDTGADDPSKESREHALWREEGMLTVTGGKLTTFRLMARESLHAVRDELPALRVGKRTRILDRDTGALPANGVDDETRARLVGRHGIEAKDVLAMPGGATPVGDSVVLWGELGWAARSEGVVHLDDLLLRRARVGLLLDGGGLGTMDAIRAVAQPELGWDDGRWDEEVARYAALWRRGYGPMV